MTERRCIAAAAVMLVGLVLAVLLVARDGGCDRTPPDDEPEPACDPVDKTCKGAEAPTPAS